MAAWPDQVFVDGKQLAQVASATDVVAGTFAVDYANQKLILGTNPAGKSITASTLDKAVSVRANDTTLSGFTVRGYATSMPTMGTITLERAGAKVSDVEAWCRTRPRASARSLTTSP